MIDSSNVGGCKFETRLHCTGELKRWVEMGITDIHTDIIKQLFSQKLKHFRSKNDCHSLVKQSCCDRSALADRIVPWC